MKLAKTFLPTATIQHILSAEIAVVLSDLFLKAPDNVYKYGKPVEDKCVILVQTRPNHLIKNHACQRPQFELSGIFLLVLI